MARSGNKDLYIEKKADDLYFVMEKVDNTNSDFWQNFADAQLKVELENLKANSKIGVVGFKASLDQFPNISKGNGELWIAYASYEPVTTRNTNNTDPKTKKLEMMMTVISNPHSKFITHMGIARSRSSIKENLPQHPQLSVALHSFAARNMRERDNSRLFMITVPVEEMRQILLKVIPEEKIWYGDNQYTQWMTERLAYIQMLKETDDLKKEKVELQNALKNNKHNWSPVVIDTDGNIKLQKKDGSGVQTIRRSDVNYNWFYKHGTLKVLKSNLRHSYNSEDLTQYITVDLEYLSNCAKDMKFTLATAKKVPPKSPTPSVNITTTAAITTIIIQDKKNVPPPIITELEKQDRERAKEKVTKNFIELKVNSNPDKKPVTKKEYEDEYNRDMKLITLTPDVATKLSITPNKFPYADYYQQQYLQKQDVNRENTCIVVARGDERMPEEIFYCGGFHPQFTNSNDKARKDTEILDVALHRKSTEGSGLSSYTLGLGVAKSAVTGSLRPEESKKIVTNKKGVVYFVKATAAITPSSFDLSNEREYTVPGGVDSEDIVAYIILNADTGEFEGSVFINKDFIKQYPSQIDTLINNSLDVHETCTDRSPLQNLTQNAKTANIYNSSITFMSQTAATSDTKTVDHSVTKPKPPTPSGSSGNTDS